MPDNTGSFLTELTEATSLGNDDLLYAVKYENGTPVSRKVRKSTVLADAVKDVKVNGRTAVNENKEAELYISYIKNEVSGDICSFDDAEAFPVDALKVGIEPVQDLHGYDAPWVGGAGKNKCDTKGYGGIGYNGGVGTEVTFVDSTIPVTVNGNKITYSVPSWGGVVFKTSGLASGTHHFHAEFSSSVNRKTFYVLNSNNVVKEANNYSDSGGTIDLSRTLESGDYIAIWIGSNNAVDITITNMQIESGNSYTTFAPYSNICPISGWDECKVTRTGKNLWGGEKLADDIVAKVPNATKDTTNKTVTYSAGNVSSKVLFDNFKPNTIYTIFMMTSSNANNVMVKYTDGTNEYINKDSITVTQANKSIEYIVGTWSTGTTVLKYDECGVFEGTLTAEDFVAYNGHTYTIDLNGTRYGGKVDLVSGAMTVDRVNLKLGDLTWTYDSSWGQGADFYSNVINGAKVPPNNQTVANALCSHYSVVSRDSIYNSSNSALSLIPSGIIKVRDDNYSDAAAFKTAMANADFTYELATPITIQLTPTVVKSLGGLNNVWADTGEIKKLVYIQDNSDTLNELLDRADETDADIKNLQDNLLNKSIMSMNFDRIDLSYLASIGTVQYNKNLRWFNSSYTPVIQDGDDIVVDVPVQAIKDLGIQVLTWTRGMSTQSFIWYTTNVGGYNNSSVTQILVSNISDYATRLCIALNKNNPYILVQADMKDVTRSTDIFHWIRNNDIPDGEISLQKINGALNVEITVGIFDKMVFVGDSFTGGAIVKPDSSWSTVGDRTWGQLICKRNGIEAGVFGVGGATTRSYLTSGLPLVLADTAGDFYMFALGLNDNYSLGSSYIGTVSDIKVDYTQNPDTFYGNYARIIEQVMAHAPKARFCMVKMQTHSGSWSDFNTAIQTIAEHYEIPWIDPYDDVFFTSSVYRTMVGGHPTLLGYNGMSLAYERLLSQCFMDNQVYFRYAGINIS